MSLPEDKYSSGNRDDQCWVELYGLTKEQADVKRDKYFNSYPVQGYNTETVYESWIEKGSMRYYYIKMTRWHSCD